MIFRLILLVTSLVFSDYLGGYSGSGFRYSTNARDMSLGGSLMSEYNQGFNSFSNPALLSKVRNLEVGMSYFPMSLDRFVQTFSISRSLSSLGGASLSVFNSGVSSIQGKDFYNNSLGDFSSSEGYVMLSVGSRLGRRLNAGLNIKVIFNNIDEYSATGIAADFGMLYDLSDKLALSVVLNNIFGKYSWEGLSSGSASFDQDLPNINSLAIKYDISSFLKSTPISDMNLFSRIDFMDVDNVKLSRLRSGIELGYLDYIFRLGMVQNRGIGNFNAKILLGMGFKNKFFKFDYCIDFGKENEGISNLFSISFIK